MHTQQQTSVEESASGRRFGSAGSTARFAELVSEFSAERIPPPVLQRTKEILYDGIGALLSATSARYDILSVLSRFTAESGGTPEAQIFGSALRTNIATAALVNGALGYYCDIEAHHAGAIMHPMAVVAPAALAVGERQASSGRDVLAAFLIGTDVACRVSYALRGPVLYARGFHPTCVAGTFGSLAAAARLLGLRGRQLLHAFGLAGTTTSGLLAWSSDPTEHSRPFNMGLAARNGVYAAHLAACGFGGPPAIFEGKYPLGQAFSGEWREAELFEGFGERFKMMELYFKLYACCAFIHPGLDGLLDIIQAERLAGDDIAGIVLRFPRGGYRIIDSNALRSHCAQYVLALAAYKGQVDFYDILHDQRSDVRIRSLSERIEVVGDDETDRTYPDLYRSIITVETHKGARYTRDVTHPKGSPENPVDRHLLDEKFARLTRDVLDDRKRRQITDLVGSLEQVADIRELTRLLAVQA